MRNRTSKAKTEEPGDHIRLRGAMEYALKDARTGEVIRHGSGPNVVLLVGRRYILNKLGADSVANLINRIYLGSSNAAETNTHTGLQSSMMSQTFNVGSTNNSSSSAPHIIFCASWASSETHTNSSSIHEFGLYYSDSAVARKTTSSGIDFRSSNTLTVSYTLSN